MKSFNYITKLLIFFPYYFFHRNYFFGIIFKIFVKKFYFKNFSFDINVDNIKVSQLSSFLFNTYEYNDRVLILKYISKKNHSIIIGGGIKTKKDILNIKSAGASFIVLGTVLEKNPDSEFIANLLS